MIEKILILCIIFWLVDTISGVVIAKFINNNFKSHILKKSLIIKGVEFLISIVFTISENYLNTIGINIPIAEFTTTMFLFQEVTSLIENYNIIKKEVKKNV